MCDIGELLEYWQEEPPTHVILGWRYLDRKKKPAVDEKETLAAFGEMQGMMGTRPQPIPAHLKEMIGWAEEQKLKMAH